MTHKLTSMLLALAGGVMAQPPTLVVKDYLREVRVFAPTSPEFAKAAADLGVTATLSTLGENASLVAAVRSDSGGTVEIRTLWDVVKDGKPAYGLGGFEVGRRLDAGEATLVAPGAIGGELMRLLFAGRPHQSVMPLPTGAVLSVDPATGAPSLGRPGPTAGLLRAGAGPTGALFSGVGPTEQTKDLYQGAQFTLSIDSVTLDDGKFIGADTRKYFDDLMAEDATRKSFFNDLTGLLSTGQSQAQIDEALMQRQEAVRRANFTVSGDGATGTIIRGTPSGTPNPAAPTEMSLCSMSLVRLRYFGIESLRTWAVAEKITALAKPTLHR